MIASLLAGTQTASDRRNGRCGTETAIEAHAALRGAWTFEHGKPRCCPLVERKPRNDAVDHPETLGSDDDQPSRLAGALRRSRRIAPAPALSGLGRRGSRVAVTSVAVKQQCAPRSTSPLGRRRTDPRTMRLPKQSLVSPPYGRALVSTIRSRASTPALPPRERLAKSAGPARTEPTCWHKALLVAAVHCHQTQRSERFTSRQRFLSLPWFP